MFCVLWFAQIVGSLHLRNFPSRSLLKNEMKEVPIYKSLISGIFSFEAFYVLGLFWLPCNSGLQLKGPEKLWDLTGPVRFCS